MLRRKLLVPATVLLVFAASPWRHPVASAGWTPVAGFGSYFDTISGQYTRFTTSDGSFSLGYDPDNPGASSIYFSTGRPGFGADADEDFSVSNGGTTFSAYYGIGGTVTLSFGGDPGPLNSQGDPLSLNYISNYGGIIYVTPSYNFDELTFVGEFGSVPEPASLVTLTLGLAGVSLAGIARRRRQRRRPAPESGDGPPSRFAGSS